MAVWASVLKILKPAMAAILKFFKQHLLPNRKLDWAKTWWEALEQHRDSELLKSLRLAIQNGCLGGHLETASAPKPYFRLIPNLVDGNGVTWRLRIVKIIQFRYPRWSPCSPSWKSSNDISSQSVSWIKLKLDGRHWSSIEIQQGSGKPNFFWSQTKIKKLGPIGNSQKPQKSVPYWPNTKEIFSDSVRCLGYSQILNLPSSDVNPLITHD